MAKQSLSDDKKFRDVTDLMLANMSFLQCEQDFTIESSLDLRRHMRRYQTAFVIDNRSVMTDWLTSAT